jgi:hypothetical protein
MTDKKLSDNLPFVDDNTPHSLIQFPDVGQNPLYSSESARQEFKNWDDYDRVGKKLRNDRYEEDTKHRRNLSTWASFVVSLWLIVVLIILILNTSYIKLSDTVMVALLSTTTLNVLGMMVIVLKGLFEDKN